MPLPNDLIFISAQPDETYFHWQVELYLYNFYKKGIPKEHCFALFSIKCKPSDYIVNLKKEHPGIYWYQDERPNKVKYVSSVRPQILKKFFAHFPEKGKNVFYHDSDILFNHLPPFKDLLRDDISYLSDTIDYIGYNYIKNCCSRFQKVHSQLSDTDLLDKMADCVGISPQLIKDNQENSGGAQYLLKNIDAQYWAKVEHDSIKLYDLMSNYEKQYPVEKGIQKWTADMWAVLWNIWKRGLETIVHDELSFSWATYRCDDKKHGYNVHNILHLAGVTEKFLEKHPDYFFKGHYNNKNVIEVLKEDIHFFDYVNPNNTSGKYIENAIEYVSKKFHIDYIEDNELRDQQNKIHIKITDIKVEKAFRINYQYATGTYHKSEEIACGKSVWICKDNDKLIFYNSQIWILTDMKYRAELNESSGGFLFSSKTQGEPYEAYWQKEIEISRIANEFTFSHPQLSKAYFGVYSRTEEKFNNKSIWKSERTSKLMFFSGNHWVITDIYPIEELTTEVQQYIKSLSTYQEPYDAKWYV